MGFFIKLIHYLSLISYVLIGAYVIVLVPCIFQIVPIVVLSGSMEPTFDTGSVIYYKKVDQNELEVNDILVYNLDENNVTHRINSIEDNLYITKGDANDKVDPLGVEYSNVLGKAYEFSIPYLGYYISFVNKNLYLLIFVALILILEFFLGEKSNI